MRIFRRDGQKFSRAQKADPGESPNADIVNAFLNEMDGQTFQSCGRRLPDDGAGQAGRES